MLKTRKILIYSFALWLFSILSLAAFAQKEIVYHTFKGTRVVNGHSVEAQREGELEMIIAHRFGRLNGGPYELFGLDQANMRIGLEYGLKDWLSVGAGRNSYEKTYDGFVKVRLLRQRVGGLPFSATYVGGMAYRTMHETDSVRALFATNRMFYSHQLLLASKIGDRFSFQLMPTVVHRNFTESLVEKNDVKAMGVAARVRLNKNFALTGEYYYILPNQLADIYFNPAGIGIDIETGGHVFQLHFTNSRGMTERFFIPETTGNWLKGDIHFGFNMGRIFKVKGRWY
ncbi:MAG: DUF5777 family beta-barrel protein [Bacteroidia bacterium]|nr:DUF5777 family beta-barrel protein [Bacteroidia bacterium]